MMNITRSPVLFLTFNRPEYTKRVFARIREARPAQLFLAQDGPRLDRTDEKEKVERVRKIISKVDWPCTVTTDASDTNLGCKMRVSSAITWALSQVDRVIILEDDCIPSLS